MTDSKFCEHGVNVGLENPPVFCGQCPPDTITKLRADLASVRLDYANECDRARRAEARYERDKDELRADLARVTDERDEARAKVAGLTLSPDAVARAKGACSYFAALDLMTDHGRAKHRETVEELTRYAEALGVRS